jgi:signal transduction histidine kinase
MKRLIEFVTKQWTRFFLNASAPRAYLETLVVFGSLVVFTLLVYQSIVRDMTMASLVFLINPCSALYYSLRLRIPTGRWYRQLGMDVLWLAGPTLLLNPAIWLATRTFLLDMFANGSDMLTVSALYIGLLGFPYLFFRVVIRFILWWDALRQRRVIWSLVSSNLVAVALLQALIVLPLAILFYFSGWLDSSFVGITNSLAAELLYRLQMLLPLVGLAMLIATVVLVALLPVSIGVSYFFARRIRRRLELLLDAAHAARDGNYETQIEVSGYDEIARLQADFNVMTATLKVNIEALRDEREKVATLLKTRRELMANVSHELRTPIATVRAYLESALRQDNGASGVTLSQEDLDIIQRETVRLQTLIDDLFALSRAEVDQLTVKSVPIDGAALIRRVVETVSPLAWRINRVEMVTDIPNWLPQILADESRLEQVLRNLIHNSLRHTPPGGLVIVRAREVSRVAEIQVQDTGEGIQPEHLPHIWERYYRDAENGGTGLGLALVKSFIEAMHGQVSVTSTLGEGACFTVSLPLADPSSEIAPSLPKPQPVLHAAAENASILPTVSR